MASRNVGCFLRLLAAPPPRNVQILSLSPKSLIFFLSIQSLNSMSPALSHFNNSPGVGSEGSEPPSTHRTTVTLSLNTIDESFRDVYHLSKGLRSGD